MADGVLYKFNATTSSKSVCKKFNATAVSDGIVKHANATTWYKNYPMEQVYTQDFVCTYTQGYNSAGVHLYDPTWGDHIYNGGGDGFRSLIGFDKSAISSFVTATGIIQSVTITVNLKETSLNGHPTVQFVPHQCPTELSAWDASKLNMSYNSTYTFPNDSDVPGLGGYVKALTANHIKHPTTGVFFDGIAVVPSTNTEEDWGVFTGKSGYSTKLTISVLK